MQPFMVVLSTQTIGMSSGLEPMTSSHSTRLQQATVPGIVQYINMTMTAAYSAGARK